MITDETPRCAQRRELEINAEIIGENSIMGVLFVSVPFAQPTVDQALARALGRCECQRTSPCKHSGRCKNMINKDKRGSTGYGGWDARHVNPKNPPNINNCEILCASCLKAINPPENKA
jgi:hypothetical protein